MKSAFESQEDGLTSLMWADTTQHTEDWKRTRGGTGRNLPFFLLMWDFPLYAVITIE